MENKLLSFYSICETPNKDGYIGAIMITDIRGLPKEFRCTHPVKPTAVQKNLYGKTLFPYIAFDLCGYPLLKAINTKPDLLIINDKELLGMRNGSDIPVVYLTEQGADMVTVDSIDKTFINEKITSPDNKFNTIIISTHIDNKDDAHIANEILNHAIKYFSPIEPFERIHNAISVLSKNDKKFQ